ncbi:copper chaperone PCu(A)C [Aliarcobacter skirrowii]|uniref:Copper chaperone PCu(A)C n=1 Tax=Aliarcobacter skirrowii TaxID=28200 RepID=A0AAW9D7E9_9BACT|nr:copper chaperone PCu(A)C [Aliarcobacter skirrowii]MDX4068155.1 copper chaperone PCu(A)C [Aliarcobacter skirrowii]
MKKILLLISLATTFLTASTIEVKDAYARATPPNMKNSATFMVLENRSSKDVAIVKATSNVANVVELHTHDMKNGVMTMYEIPQIDIKAKSTTVLKPGGLHIMLIGLHNSLNVGDKVEIELEFNDGSKQKVVADVKSVMSGMKHH